jgi:hypothetical protein
LVTATDALQVHAVFLEVEIIFVPANRANQTPEGIHIYMSFDARALGCGSTAWKLLIVAVLLASGATGSRAAQAPPAGIERLGWLQGCWSVTTGERDVEEYWMAPKGASMLGIGRTVRGGVLVDYEMMLIRQTEDRLVFEAHPSNQTMALFHSIDVGASRIVFENSKHDFPQRIGYERKGAGLLAWIEGTQAGKLRRIEFPYLRASCGPA